MLKNNFFAVLLSAFTAFSQSDTLDLDAILQQQQSSNPVKSYTYATFKGTKIINGHSIEAPGAGILQFIIYHRFTELSGGAYEFFGLDGARVRMGLDYGISRRLSIGVGRTSDQKNLRWLCQIQVFNANNRQQHACKYCGFGRFEC